jgi:hypothetical protein
MFSNKLNNFLISATVVGFLISFVSKADMMEAGAMPPPQYIQGSEVISYYKKQQTKRKLTQQESEAFNLLTIAHHIFGIKEFESYGYQKDASEKAKTLNLSTIAQAIDQALKQKTNWDNSISKKDLEQVTKIETVLKSNLGENSYTWAWLTYQRGNKNEAKEILKKGFDRLYTNTMSLKELSSHNDTSPMYNSEVYSKILNQMSTVEENKAREKKLNEMRTHVSNLPDLMIMT